MELFLGRSITIIIKIEIIIIITADSILEEGTKKYPDW